ncbi:MFS transporter [uncultured Phycicoccus sp.]|uniref:MFS transporter n=1 Tax=uncultured Phycicoccus sp. TaxID=661422 RepID=UPI00260DFC24|nr:MFS transporter [uncultured Phycicoccus sp.]
MAVETEPPASRSSGARNAVRDAWSSLRSVFLNPALRRIQLALAGSMVGDWAYSTAVIVWAYGVGGAKLIGIWSAVRLLMMAVAAPLGATLADRFPRKLVLIASDVTRAVLVLVATAMLVADAPTLAILVVATLVSLVGCVFRPAQMAWLPSLTDKPEELAAANGASSTIESLAFFLGPALGALLIATTSVEVVFVLNALTFLWSAFLITGIHPVASACPTDETDETTRTEGADSDAPPPEGMLREMAGGFVHIAKDRDLTMVAFLVSTQTIVAGASVVFGVVFAVEILGTGPEGVGIIDSAFGVGAIVGGFVAIARAAKNRIASDLALGTALWSLPLLLVVAFPSPVTVFAAVILLGFGNPLVDVNFVTIVQRLAPDHVLGRVFGAYEGVLIATMALGAVVTPLLLDGFGIRWTMLVLALVVGLPALLSLPRCLRLDATLQPPEHLDLLRGIPIFAPLAPGALEGLARGLGRRHVARGTQVIGTGEESDLFFIIEGGRVQVTQDGTVLREEGPGEFFGEIGLLRDAPRSATITAVEDTDLLTMTREDFLAAVRGAEESMAAANEVVLRRLGRA